MVLGSLLYFYAYVDVRLDQILPISEDWYSQLSKSVIFYTGLGTFAVLNLAMNAVLGMYKSTKSFDEKSLLLKNQIHQGSR